MGSTLDTVYLQSGFQAGVNQVNTSIFQTGVIPANAESIEFKAWNTLGSAPLSVSFSGNALGLFLLSTTELPSGQDVNTYGADVEPYAGQSGALEFTATFGNWIELDDISFSTTAVPEPSPLILTGIAAAIFVARRRWRRQR